MNSLIYGVAVLKSSLTSKTRVLLFDVIIELIWCVSNKNMNFVHGKHFE